MSIKKLSIVIPAYNEARTIHHILNKVDAVQLIGNIEKEIIIVNDCSTDATAQVLREYAEAHPQMGLQLFQQLIETGAKAAMSGLNKNDKK